MGVNPGRWTRGSTDERERLEAVTAAIVGALMDLEELELRLEQAMRRSELVVAVLAPARERTVELRCELERARVEMTSYYGAQVSRWQDQRNSSS